MTVRSKTIAAIAATLALSSVGGAFAQDRPHGPDRGPRDGRYEQHDARHDVRHDDGRGRNDRNDPRYDRRDSARPHAQWRRGGRVPGEYRGRNHVVNDYRAHHLRTPPRGYQWIGVGGDYVLAAIATGLIAQIIAGQ